MNTHLTQISEPRPVPSEPPDGGSAKRRHGKRIHPCCSKPDGPSRIPRENLHESWARRYVSRMFSACSKVASRVLWLLLYFNIKLLTFHAALIQAFKSFWGNSCTVSFLERIRIKFRKNSSEILNYRINRIGTRIRRFLLHCSD